MEKLNNLFTIELEKVSFIFPFGTIEEYKQEQYDNIVLELLKKICIKYNIKEWFIYEVLYKINNKDHQFEEDIIESEKLYNLYFVYLRYKNIEKLKENLNNQ